MTTVFRVGSSQPSDYSKMFFSLGSVSWVMFSFTDSSYHGNDKSPLNQTCSTRWAWILVVNGGTWGPDKRPYEMGSWGYNPYR